MPLPLNSKSRLQPASFRSPLMFFLLVNCASAFLKFGVFPSAHRSGFLWCFVFIFPFFFFLLVATCHTWWPIEAPKTWYLQLLQSTLCNSQSLCCPFEAEGLWADVSQPMYRVSFFSESQSRWHTEAPPTPSFLFPTANSSYSSCFECVWASGRTNVFSNYNPLWWWQSEPMCPLHSGPRNAA